MTARGLRCLPFNSTNQDATGVVILGQEKSAIVTVTALEMQVYDGGVEFSELVKPRIEAAIGSLNE